MEKPMHEKPVGFLNDQKVSYKKQFGFQKKKKNVYCACSN